MSSEALNETEEEPPFAKLPNQSTVGRLPTGALKCQQSRARPSLIGLSGLPEPLLNGFRKQWVGNSTLIVGSGVNVADKQAKESEENRKPERMAGVYVSSITLVAVHP